jgi:hypothetical protein
MNGSKYYTEAVDCIFIYAVVGERCTLASRTEKSGHGVYR